MVCPLFIQTLHIFRLLAGPTPAEDMLRPLPWVIAGLAHADPQAFREASAGLLSSLP